LQELIPNPIGKACGYDTYDRKLSRISSAQPLGLGHEADQSMSHRYRGRPTLPEDRVIDHVEKKYVNEGAVSAYIALKDTCTI